MSPAAEHPGFTRPLCLLVGGVAVTGGTVIAGIKTDSAAVAVTGAAIGIALVVAGLVEGGLRLHAAVTDLTDDADGWTK